MIFCFDFSQIFHCAKDFFIYNILINWKKMVKKQVIMIIYTNKYFFSRVYLFRVSKIANAGTKKALQITTL